MKSYRVGNTNVGRFASAFEAATFHFATQAVIAVQGNEWMCVATGEIIIVSVENPGVQAGGVER